MTAAADGIMAPGDAQRVADAIFAGRQVGHASVAKLARGINGSLHGLRIVGDAVSPGAEIPFASKILVGVGHVSLKKLCRASRSSGWRLPAGTSTTEEFGPRSIRPLVPLLTLLDTVSAPDSLEAHWLI